MLWLIKFGIYVSLSKYVFFQQYVSLRTPFMVSHEMNRCRVFVVFEVCAVVETFFYCTFFLSKSKIQSRLDKISINCIYYVRTFVKTNIVGYFNNTQRGHYWLNDIHFKVIGYSSCWSLIKTVLDFKLSKLNFF